MSGGFSDVMVVLFSLSLSISLFSRSRRLRCAAAFRQLLISPVLRSFSLFEIFARFTLRPREPVVPVRDKNKFKEESAHLHRDCVPRLSRVPQDTVQSFSSRLALERESARVALARSGRLFDADHLTLSNFFFYRHRCAFLAGAAFAQLIE